MSNSMNYKRPNATATSINGRAKQDLKPSSSKELLQRDYIPKALDVKVTKYLRLVTEIQQYGFK